MRGAQRPNLGAGAAALLAALLVLPPAASPAEAPLVLDPETAAVVYSGQESMRFSVSWSGGVKLGEFRLSLAPAAAGKGQLITARATDEGLLKAVYPIDDTFVTNIRGPLKLPRRYDVEQIERGRMVRRLTVYDQRQLKAVYRKQKNPIETYSLAGPVHNEYSAFFITRVLVPGQGQSVPTFADGKRHIVPVRFLGKEIKDTIFGRIRTIKVQPKMQFRGLYDKDGDTIFWLTDDACRAPVEIRSKILIGSLVAELTEYANPACPLRPRPRRQG